MLVILAVFGILAWLRYRKRKLAVTTARDQNLPHPREESQPYLQQKSELEDDERRIHELETQRRGSREDIQPYLQRKPELEDYERRIHELEIRGRVYEIGEYTT